MLARILVTTSRRPSRRTRSFVKDLASVIPGGVRLTRGHLSYKELAVEAVTMNADRIIIIGERRGNPSILRIYKPLGVSGLKNIVTLIIRGVKLSREAGHSSVRVDAGRLIVNYDDTLEAQQVAEAFIQGLHARLKPSEGSVIVNIRGIGGGVKVWFTFRDRNIGPLMRISLPMRMIKVE